MTLRVVPADPPANEFPYRAWACARWPVLCGECRVRACESPTLMVAVPRPPDDTPPGGQAPPMLMRAAA